MMKEKGKLVIGLLVGCLLCFTLSGCGTKSVSSGSTNNEGTTVVSEDKSNDNSTNTITSDTTANSDTTTTKDTRPRGADGEIDIGKLWVITPKELLAKPDNEFVKISSEKLVHEFMDDKDTADDKYRYKYLEVSGKVDSTKRDGNGYLIIVYGGDQQNNICCWINNKEEADRAEALNLTMTNGDTVTIRGIVNCSSIEKGYMHVALGACALKEYSKK